MSNQHAKYISQLNDCFLKLIENKEFLSSIELLLSINAMFIGFLPSGMTRNRM